MDTSPHDFVTVEMRGLKAALVAHAKARRLSVSVVVRGAVARELAATDAGGQGETDGQLGDGGTGGWTKLSIRVTRAEANRLAAAAKSAGLSRGAYVVGLANGVPVLASGGGRAETIAALLSSCAELSTLSRNVHQLTALLREGDVPRAREYREMLDGLAANVRDHLTQASSALASLRERASTVARPAGGRKRSGPWRRA